MLHFLFTVVLFRFPCATGQQQRLIQDDHGLYQQGVSYANFEIHKFQHLQGPVLDSCEVYRSTDCAFTCVDNAPCVSFNVALSPKENGKLRCELLSEDKFRSPGKLTDSQQFHHYSIKSSCSKNPCKNNGSCIPNYKEGQHHCDCVPGYIGFHCKRGCGGPLGMENHQITAAQISASSRHRNHFPTLGRLHFKGNPGPWAAGANDHNQWFQIDLRVEANVSFVSTQGRHGEYDQWLTQYKLQYSKDGLSFQVYKEHGENSDKVFAANNDHDTVVKHPLIPPIEARYIRLIPTAWHHHIAMRMELYGCFECLAPLGMENFRITSAQISASSQFSGSHVPNYGRLHYNKGNAGAWSVKVNNLHQWFQIDFRIETTVTYVATQGRYNSGQWVTQYKLQYSNDGNSFQGFKQQGEHLDKMFVGNSDFDTVVKHHLTPPIKARYIRLTPTSWYDHISMRMELYGCLDDMQPLGMESGAIADSQITASTEYDVNHSAKRARLYTIDAHPYERGAWVSSTKDTNQWLQVNLGKITPVTHVATQGRNSFSLTQMVTKYKVQFSDDGASFLFYKRQGESSDAVFDGNTDHDTVVYHRLNPPITSRFLRINPTAWEESIAMRMELYTYQDD